MCVCVTHSVNLIHIKHDTNRQESCATHKKVKAPTVCAESFATSHLQTDFIDDQKREKGNNFGGGYGFS